MKIYNVQCPHCQQEFEYKKAPDHKTKKKMLETKSSLIKEDEGICRRCLVIRPYDQFTWTGNASQGVH